MKNRHGTKKAVAIMVWFTGPDSRELMLTKRRNGCKTFKGWWAAVGGSVEEGECAIHAAQREIQEETGVYIPREELRLIDSYQEDDFKCFMFETEIGRYRFNDFKNKEPKKHSPWHLFSPKAALALPDLMPALREILLTKPQV